MLNPRLFYPIYLTTISIWWGLTFFTDILVAPVIFRVVENFFNAGDLAMALFTRLNSVEVILSTLTVTILALISRRQNIKWVLALGIVVWAVSIFYFSYLIPKIVTLSELWKQADEMGVMGIGEIPDIQQEHQLYHRIYVTMDVCKLVLLSVLLAFGIFKSEKLT